MPKESPTVVIKNMLDEQISNMLNPNSPRDSALRCHNYCLGIIDYARKISIINTEQYDHFRNQIDSVINSIM